VRAAVIGFGNSGPNIVRNLLTTGNAQVVRVCYRPQDRLAPAQERCPLLCARRNDRKLHVTTDPCAVTADPNLKSGACLVLRFRSSTIDFAGDAPLRSRFRSGPRVLAEPSPHTPPNFRQGILTYARHTVPRPERRPGCLESGNWSE
jgi:hypothetical protein